MPDLFQLAAAQADLASVRLDPELRRIEGLPRRVWDQTAEGLVDVLGGILRHPWGRMRLRPIQAVALAEIGTVGGFFGPLRVGAGKTLISALAPSCAFAERPLLVVPAALVDKTRREFAYLAEHWSFNPTEYSIRSYEWLGREQAAGFLAEMSPDLIVCDEVHRLKNPRAAVTRRVGRYMTAEPATRFVAMSGTITSRSLLDFAHILRWTHKPHGSPLPSTWNALQLWAGAIDERKGPHEEIDPGALEVLCNARELRIWRNGEPRRAARLGFRRRLVETPGIVATKSTPVDASILVRAIAPPPSSAIAEAFETLRREWTTPDEWPVDDGLAMSRHARELALGFYYVWDPRPPDYWLEARREWSAYVRRVLSHSRRLDSELQVRREHASARECREWLAVRDDFEPNTVARWIDDTVVERCADWLDDERGIVWTEHTCFAERLAEVSGAAYYGRKGRDARGRMIEDHPPAEGMIASIASNATGRNLQAWSKNLIASPPGNGLKLEQLMGRTHRDGQTADEVFFDVLVACREHAGAFAQAVRDARFVFETTGSPQKVLDADVDVPSGETIGARSGPRWN